LPGRARNLFYGHGGYVDEQIGELIAPPAIAKPKDELVKALQEVEEGKFIPDRERDVLTKALGMPNTLGKHEDWDLFIHGASGLPRM
jgi:hypothetical protein